jgi:hypothetical protein
MNPDSELAAQLRKDLTAKRCAEEVLRAATDMADAIGVKVLWEISYVDDNKKVDRAQLIEALGRLATSGGAMLMGSQVNPISTLKTQDPLRTLRENA